MKKREEKVEEKRSEGRRGEKRREGGILNRVTGEDT